jgi:hypothetical protein
MDGAQHASRLYSQLILLRYTEMMDALLQVVSCNPGEKAVALGASIAAAKGYRLGHVNASGCYAPDAIKPLLLVLKIGIG